MFKCFANHKGLLPKRLLLLLPLCPQAPDHPPWSQGRRQQARWKSQNWQEQCAWRSFANSGAVFWPQDLSTSSSLSWILRLPAWRCHCFWPSGQWIHSPGDRRVGGERARSYSPGALPASSLWVDCLILQKPPLLPGSQCPSHTAASFRFWSL